MMEQLVWLRNLSAVLLVGLTGCASPPPTVMTAANLSEYKDLATATVRSGLGFQDNAAVRVGAVEALESIEGDAKLPWIRSALSDAHPAVRFAACVALGKLRDAVSAKAIGRLSSDADPNVRIASLFARHRLGDTSKTGKLATYLLENEEPTVRRNAALVMGLSADPSFVPILARAVSDSDPGVRMHALEAMARLGNQEAKKELTFQANSGVGAEETFALEALSETRDTGYVDTYRYKLINGAHLETRLAAARGLGLLGFDDGLDLALKAISSNRRRIQDRDDPEPNQILRARQLGAAALGAIGRTEALPRLASLLKKSNDPRVQISYARAILEILTVRRHRAVLFRNRPHPQQWQQP